MSDNEKLERLVERCAEARKLYERSEIDYYEFLFSIQESEKEVWAVFTTFETFIERCVGRPNPAKWTRYIQARERLGIGEIRRVGVPSSFEALEIEDQKKRRAYIEEQAAWSEQHNGVHASEQYARTGRERIDPKPERATPSVNRLHELDRVKAENVDLRRENSRLKAENLKLRERLEKAEGAAADKRVTARKPVGKRQESHAT